MQKKESKDYFPARAPGTERKRGRRFEAALEQREFLERLAKAGLDVSDAHDLFSVLDVEGRGNGGDSIKRPTTTRQKRRLWTLGSCR